MLGYIVTKKSELKVREAELYKAYYCGVCKSLSKRYGQIPRFTLSYDAAFLALVLDSIFEDGELLTNEGCIANPFKKKPIAHSQNIDFAADIMIILTWYKILDDIRDENKFYAKILKLFYRFKFKKALSKNEKIANLIERNLLKLNEFEREKTHVADKVADCFGRIMRDIFQEGVKNMEKSTKDEKYLYEAMGELGYQIGRWVYVIDAVDDVENDIENGAYNPLIYRFNYHDTNSIDGISKLREQIKTALEPAMLLSLDSISKAIDILPIKKNKGIIENIIYIGLLNKTDEILRIKCDNFKGEKHEKSV